MKDLHFVSILFLFAITLSDSPMNYETDYSIYHMKINQAEKEFLYGEADSSIVLYKKIFERFDFIYAKDCIIAAQISALQMKKETTNQFVYRSIRQGVNLNCLQSIPIIDNYLTTTNGWPGVKMAYDSLHKAYLKSIDFKKKMKYVNHYLEEQDSKLNNSDYYKSILYANYSEIAKEIKMTGFPGDKMIGIDDSIYSPEGDDCRLSPENTLITLYHYPCSFTDLKSILLQEIKKGNLHPRDYAYICEFERRLFLNNHNTFLQCKPEGNYPDYKIEWFKSYTEKEIVIADSLRKEIYICPFEQDIKKKECEEKYGFKFFFGFGIGYFGGHR